MSRLKIHSSQAAAKKCGVTAASEKGVCLLASISGTDMPLDDVFSTPSHSVPLHRPVSRNNPFRRDRR
jgi:hypothetical protein